ncbi:MAG: glycosyltransferase [Bacteroidales bacterium]|nr:glycosyltransferase [Bacteroidales bacterium]
MLSICIPVFNYDVKELAYKLHLQATENLPGFEILLVDDHSDEKYRILNTGLQELKNASYIELDENIGRSKIRNLLAEKAQFENLLFLDCDVEIIRDDFLSHYIEEIKQGEKVVCGGHVYQKNPPEPQKYLHWFYGIKREVKTTTQRQQSPNDSFMTANFLISKELFGKIRFDERISGYGHEDTLLGYELDKFGIKTNHIDNPVLHAGLDTGTQFLEKTRESTRNLLKLYQFSGFDKKISHKIKALRAFRTAEKLGLQGIIAKLFSAFRQKMENNLLGPRPRLFILDFYKLGYLCQVKSGE